MVNLPQIDVEKSVQSGASSSVSGSEITSAFGALAAGLGSIADTLRQGQVEDASIEGSDAVYRDENGNIKYDPRSNYSASGRAFNRAARVAALSTASTDSQDKLLQMRLDANGDVAKFDVSAKAYYDALIESAPKDMRGPLKMQLQRDITEVRNGMTVEQNRNDMAANESAIKSRIDFTTDELKALARQGGTGTKEYLEKLDEVKTLLGELSGNPAFRFNSQEADVFLKRLEANATGEWILGRIDDAYASGGIEAADKFINEELNNPDLKLSPAERAKYQREGRTWLNARKSERRAAVTQLKKDAAPILEGFKSGVSQDDGVVDDMIAQAEGLGDVTTATRLREARQLYDFNKSFKQLPDKEQAATLDGMATGGNAVDLFARKTVGVESGGNPNAKNPKSTATGAGQFIEGTWMDMVRKYRPDLLEGRTRQQVLDLRKDGALSFEMTKHYAQENADALTKAGVPVNQATLYLAHFAGSGGAIAIMKAAPYASALAVLGEAAIEKNPFLAGKSVAWVQNWAANKMGSASAVDPSMFKEARTEVAKDMKANWGNIKQGLLRGYDMSPEDVSLLHQQMGLVGDEDFNREVNTFFESRIDQFPSWTPFQQEQWMTQMQQDGVSVDEVDILGSMQSIHDATVKELDRDPVGLVAKAGNYSQPVQDLDLSNMQNFGKSLADRQGVVNFIGDYYGREGIGAFRPAEVEALGNYLKTAPVAEKLQVLQTMRQGLTPETYMASVQQIHGKDTLMGLAGDLMQTNPEVAASVVRGADALKIEPKLAPKGDKEEDQAVMQEALPRDAVAPSMGQAYNDFTQAARAVYADLSQQAGDTSGVLNPDRWTSAVNAVTGGFVEYAGKKIIAPEYGMSQDQFDKVMDSLTDSDIQGASVAINGAQIDLATFKENAVLTSVGDGQYLVQFSGGVPTSTMSEGLPYLRDQNGQAFVLDLNPQERAKKSRDYGDVPAQEVTKSAAPAVQMGSPEVTSRGTRERVLYDPAMDTTPKSGGPSSRPRLPDLSEPQPEEIPQGAYKPSSAPYFPGSGRSRPAPNKPRKGRGG